MIVNANPFFQMGSFMGHCQRMLETGKKTFFKLEMLLRKEKKDLVIWILVVKTDFAKFVFNMPGDRNWESLLNLL